MKKFKTSIFFIFLLLLLNSCGTVREGLQNTKKNNSDEFLVEKKSPLIMPPDFDELPVPKKSKKKDIIKEKDIKKLIIEQKGNVENDELNIDLEGSILKKIKKN